MVNLFISASLRSNFLARALKLARMPLLVSPTTSPSSSSLTTFSSMLVFVQVDFFALASGMGLSLTLAGLLLALGFGATFDTGSS